MFAEYPKEFALTTQPPSGREGDRGGAVEGARDRAFLIQHNSFGRREENENKSVVLKKIKYKLYLVKSTKM